MQHPCRFGPKPWGLLRCSFTQHKLVDELSVMGCAGSRILPCWVADFVWGSKRKGATRNAPGPLCCAAFRLGCRSAGSSRKLEHPGFDQPYEIFPRKSDQLAVSASVK